MVLKLFSKIIIQYPEVNRSIFLEVDHNDEEEYSVCLTLRKLDRIELFVQYLSIIFQECVQVFVNEQVLL